MTALRDLGIVISEGTNLEAIFENQLSDFLSYAYKSPSQYISHFWDLYKNSGACNNSLNGSVFHALLAIVCYREDILPLYLEADISFIPNVKYDIIFYDQEIGPICWSAKTSLRERYKQADLEAFALHNVHRKSLTYLITLDENESLRVQQKIETGDVMGIDKVILANTESFDNLIQEMKGRALIKPEKIDVISSSKVIIKKKGS